MQLEDLPPELVRIILTYKREMEQLEGWFRFLDTVFSSLLLWEFH